MSAFIEIWQISSKGKPVRLEASALNMQAVQTKSKQASGYMWIHMNALDPATRVWMIDDPDIDTHATETLLAGDSRPRTIPYEDKMLINLRGVNLNSGSEPTDMVGIRLLVSATRIISVERRSLRARADISARFEHQDAPNTPGGFVALLAETLAERMGPTLTEMAEKVDVLEDAMEGPDEIIDRAKLSDLRRDALALKRFLAPQRDALNTLALQSVPWIGERDRLHIRHVADQMTRITEELETIRERCAVLRDHLADKRAEIMNKNMMLLSVVAAIFLPLGLVSGMMGINVGGMPWVDNPAGFWLVSAMVVIIGLVQLAIFRWLKWL